MMRVVVVANCFGFELRRALLQHINFAAIYPRVDIISTYLANGICGNIEKLLRNADLVITQNPKVPHWGHLDNIKSFLKPSAVVIKSEFWRFNGFWPVASPQQRKNAFYWFPVDDFGRIQSFEDYNSVEIDREAASRHFLKSKEKFSEIDQQSDISMEDFFFRRIAKHRDFSDEWHPYPEFFQDLSKKIVCYLGVAPSSVDTLPALGVNNDRYRIIPKSICETLNLDTSAYQRNFFYFNKEISVETYFYFGRYLLDNRHLTKIENQQDLKELYFNFFGNVGAS
ncbi:WcbI family polysaccharide biosynthesis putative acetyltransferase [Sulfitobacter dubius]|uniref:WcbI family polysaccharide biosynthesis putative acetyltransferase n=1 Tax=Sulfitobacter dubius TaxID=218673 RepID=UPI00294349B7|nr:WcbI family polysaccharide biosynthesis putative acetyltransferase [Sulfitobacter dubius]WOI31303.1 WcbI family polysaccharide biosynthesis putative acetyltransferase [Sulfitobacter dubius]